MGKASSNKKVARAARAGGSRARAAGERNLLFPSMMAVVVLLGVALVVFARSDRQAEALVHPVAFDDHWHAAYGMFVCDEFLPALPEFEAPQNGGTHTHGDGLFHIHPFSTARAGENATLSNFVADAGSVLGGSDGLSDTAFAVPGGDTFTEGDDTCDGLDGDPIVQVAVWDNDADALAGEEPKIVTEGLVGLRFLEDGQVFTVAFAPEGTELAPPPSTADLANVSATDPAPTSSTSAPDASTSTTEAGGSTTTTAGDATTTTEADGTTTTTEGGAATTTTAEPETTTTKP